MEAHKRSAWLPTLQGRVFYPLLLEKKCNNHLVCFDWGTPKETAGNGNDVGQCKNNFKTP